MNYTTLFMSNKSCSVTMVDRVWNCFQVLVAIENGFETEVYDFCREIEFVYPKSVEPIILTQLMFTRVVYI